MRPGVAFAAVVGVGLVVGGLLGACETVDLGAPPSDVNVCHPSQIYFVQHVWPDILDSSYGGKHCSDSQCHGIGNQTGLTFIASPQPAMQPATMAMPDPPVTLPLPDDWLANYQAASKFMDCDDPSEGQLILTPTSPNHGGGMLFSQTSTEALELEKWPTVSP